MTMTKGIFRIIGVYEAVYFLVYIVFTTMHIINQEVAWGFVTASVLSLLFITFNHVKNEKSETASAIVQYSGTIAILVLALTKTGM